MIILNPLEPWPGELALGAAAANDVDVIARVVDYGGLFHDDVLPGHAFAETTIASSVPATGSSRAGGGSSGCARSPSATR